jgi:hypothetical protein
MCNTFVSFTCCTWFTSKFITSLTASMCYTFMSFTYCTCLASKFIASLTASMCYTFISFTLCTCLASKLSLYMTTSYINSRDINHIVIYICSLHRLPPPCATHLSVLPCALAWHPISLHRLRDVILINYII